MIDFDKHEMWEAIRQRFHRMVELGVRPHPMFDRNGKDLTTFQRWASLGL